jgi:hypothetical protein
MNPGSESGTGTGIPQQEYATGFLPEFTLHLMRGRNDMKDDNLFITFTIVSLKKGNHRNTIVCSIDK